MNDPRWCGAPKGVLSTVPRYLRFLMPFDHRMLSAGHRAVRYTNDIVGVCRTCEDAEAALGGLPDPGGKVGTSTAVRIAARAEAYGRGLLLEGASRSSPWPRRLPGGNVQAPHWQDPLAVRPILATASACAVLTLGPDVWIADDTGFPKNDRQSGGHRPAIPGDPGQGRQWPSRRRPPSRHRHCGGVAGRVAFLPEERTNGPTRCAGARVPIPVRFQRK